MNYKFEDIEVELEIVYKPMNRNTYIRVKNGKVIVTSFKHLNAKEIETMFKANYSFIKSHLSKPTPDKVIHIFGKPYELVITASSVDDTEISDDKVIIKTKKMEYSYIKKLVDKLYLKLISDFSFNHFDEAYDLFRDTIDDYPILDFKVLKTCYGKCTPKKNTIVFASHLAKYDPIYIKLVMVHELCHYKYLDHQEGFYNLFESKIKNAKKLQHQLRKIKYNDYF